MKLMNVGPAVREAQQVMAKKGQTDRLYFVYRCRSCGRLITKIEILEARAHGRMALCLCGSRRIQPTNTSLWEELTVPRMWKMLYAMYTKQLAPPPDPPTPEEQKEADRVAHEAMRAFERQALETMSRLP